MEIQIESFHRTKTFEIMAMGDDKLCLGLIHYQLLQRPCGLYPAVKTK